MWQKIIDYFAHRHLLANLIVAAVFIGSVIAWQNTGKEDMPAITFDTVRISVRYPGAPAEDVEYFVTKPIEEEVRGLDGVFRITSTSSVGQSNVTVELEPNYPKIDEAVTEIRNAVLDVDLPIEVIDDPTVRVFKTSKRAIVDIALIHKGAEILDVETRRQLQEYAFALENQLLNLREVYSIEKSGYLQEELQVRVRPLDLLHYDIPFNKVMSEVKANHIRKPAGTLETDKEPKVTLISELDTPEKLRNLIVQGGFEGQVIRLGQVADVESSYEKNEMIFKVNGYEAVMLNVVKNSSVGILEALNAVNRVVGDFRAHVLDGTQIEIVKLDDESIDLRNRLNLIGTNGTFGFILILISLFVFLDRASGVWVAAGIPFSFCATMIMAAMMGHTINGTTLAAVIIVMGMIVDDAIVVAENVTRLSHAGRPLRQAVVEGTAYVFLPILASITTTCVAFIPLFFFEGRFGRFAAFMPPIIFLMLGSSLFESIFILPGHMLLKLPGLAMAQKEEHGTRIEHWFDRVEDRYRRILERIIPWRWFVFGFFAVLLVFSWFVVTEKMKFVMFPVDETREIVISGEAAAGTTRYETARMARAVEEKIIPYIGKEVVGFRTEVARSRRGGAVEENKFRTEIEILPKKKRKKSADQLISEFKSKIDGIKDFQKIEFSKSRWGQDSGSSIELVVQQNNDEIRHDVAQKIFEDMDHNSALISVELDEGYRVPEYRIRLDDEKLMRLSIGSADVASTFRAALEGSILYEFSNGDEDVRVRFSTVDGAKSDIEQVLDLPVENNRDYLVPLRSVVEVEKTEAPNAIARRGLKRTTTILANIKKGSGKTPLEIADHYEKKVFPKLLAQYPSTQLSFTGEIEDTRESGKDFQNAVFLVLFLIYIILAVLFNSLTKPLIVMLTIPFGMVGIILAFLLHGKMLYGFYACVGALGLAGVVVNDAIIMLFKLEDEFDLSRPKEEIKQQVAAIASTRLRAVFLTTLTTVVGVLPTAYGLGGYDEMLADMMLALSWGLSFGTLITLVLIPCVYSANISWRYHAGKAER